MDREELIERITSDAINRLVTETSRRQKAISSFLGVNNKVKTFGIITAENPMGMKLTRRENQERNNALNSYLAERQFLYCRVKGKYGDNIEHPCMVYNVSVEDLKYIGKVFGQESFIYAEIVYEQGQPRVIFSFYEKDSSESEYRFIENKDVYVPIDKEAKDVFTAIGRNFKFNIPFDIFNEAINKFNDLINERCKRYEQYRLMCDKLINESIQSKRTSRSRRLRRAQLYGKHFEKFL